MADRSDSIGEMRAHAFNFRAAIEKCSGQLRSISLKDFPRGACGDVADMLGLFLQDALNIKCDRVAGWNGDQSHAWLEFDGHVIDVTADQFGSEEQVLISEKSAFHDRFGQQQRREPSISDAVGEHLRNLRHDYRLLLATISEGLTDPVLPYGLDELDACPQRRDSLVRCFVKGCTQFVRPAKEPCPQHGIRCHLKGTYSYQDSKRNAVIDAGLFDRHIIGSTVKQECEWLGYENSEDALTWNIFRSLQRAGCLGKIASLLLGVPSAGEPSIYFWGMSAAGDAFNLWDLLRKARDHFEKGIRPPSRFTEPDVALHLPGKYLVLIEAKFTSINTVLPPRGRKQKRIIERYGVPNLSGLDSERGEKCERFCDQLWRNMVFAEWMAEAAGEGTEPFLVNLVRAGAEEASASAFGSILKDEQKHRFRRATWEQIYRAIPPTPPIAALLRTYMEKKTANLQKAFRL